MKTMVPLLPLMAFCVGVIVAAPWIIVGLVKYCDWVSGVIR